MLLAADISSDAWGNIRWLYQDSPEGWNECSKKTRVRIINLNSKLRPQRKIKAVSSTPSPLTAMPVLSLVLKTRMFSLTLKPHVPTKQSTASATPAWWKVGSSVHGGERTVGVTWCYCRMGGTSCGKSLQQNKNLTDENKHKIMDSLWKLSWGHWTKGEIFIQDKLLNFLSRASVSGMLAMTRSFNPPLPVPRYRNCILGMSS